jgi:hypothetical protein
MEHDYKPTNEDVVCIYIQTMLGIQEYHFWPETGGYYWLSLVAVLPLQDIVFGSVKEPEFNRMNVFYEIY